MMNDDDTTTKLNRIVNLAKSEGIYVDHSPVRGVIVRYERDPGMPELIRIDTMAELRRLIGR